jgi:uroporphyrinogen-III synthase
MKDKWKILYLGLDPSRYKKEVFHYPIIRIVPCPFDKERIQNHSDWTHVLFTSRIAVTLFFELFKAKPLNVKYLVVGKATMAKVKEYGHFPLLCAVEETSEGVIQLLNDFEGHLCYPHSALSRPVISNYLREKRINHTELILYTTVAQAPEPKPNIEEFDEIVFTSPSTVQAFQKIFGKLPFNKKLTSIGSITEKSVAKFLHLD